MDDSRFKDVSSLLSAFFDDETLKKGGRWAAFYRDWKEIAGERLAAHSRVGDIVNGILVVEAEHPGWVQLLQLRQDEILEATRQRYPELGLRGIQFRLAKAAHAGAAPAPTVEATAPGETRLGPYGPGARAPREGLDEAGAAGQGEEGAEAESPGGPAQLPRLDEIEDQGLRELLSSLKKTVDGGREG